MAVFNIDLGDGQPPVSFVLNLRDAERFQRFMAECNALTAERDALRAQVEALSAERDAALNRSSDLMATNGRLRQQIEAFRDQVAGDCL